MSAMTATTARGTNVSDREKSHTSTAKNVSELAGRILLSVLFLLSGVGKIGASHRRRCGQALRARHHDPHHPGLNPGIRVCSG